MQKGACFGFCPVSPLCENLGFAGPANHFLVKCASLCALLCSTETFMHGGISMNVSMNGGVSFLHAFMHGGVSMNISMNGGVSFLCALLCSTETFMHGGVCDTFGHPHLEATSLG